MSVLRAGVLWACLLRCSVAAAQARQAAPLTQGDDALVMPGVGKVALVFVLVAALAVGIAVVLRRVLPKFAALPAAGGSMRVLNRLNLGGGLRIYAVQYEDRKVLLAEGRHGLALSVLKDDKESAA